MRIAHPVKSKLFLKPEYTQVLPPSWYTLFLLSKLSVESLEAGIQAGVIRSDMEQEDAKKLLGHNVHALKAFSGNNEYYTPGQFIEAAREVMGEIDLDPASCALAQETVRANSAMPSGCIGSLICAPRDGAGAHRRGGRSFSYSCW